MTKFCELFFMHFNNKFLKNEKYSIQLFNENFSSSKDTSKLFQTNFVILPENNVERAF